MTLLGPSQKVWPPSSLALLGFPPNLPRLPPILFPLSLSFPNLNNSRPVRLLGPTIIITVVDPLYHHPLPHSTPLSMPLPTSIYPSRPKRKRPLLQLHLQPHHPSLSREPLQRADACCVPLPDA
jgi:hypothetical protein